MDDLGFVLACYVITLGALAAYMGVLLRRARRTGRRRPERDLATGRSWFPLDAAGALLRPGPTGTNVMDVVAILVEPR